MRPAYVTRCPDCLERVEISDEMRKKVVDKKTVYWFNPDDILRLEHNCK